MRKAGQRRHSLTIEDGATLMPKNQPDDDIATTAYMYGFEQGKDKMNQDLLARAVTAETKVEELRAGLATAQARAASLEEAGSKVLVFAAEIEIAFYALMWTWKDKASPEIIAVTEKHRQMLLEAAKAWRMLVPNAKLPAMPSCMIEEESE